MTYATTLNVIRVSGIGIEVKNENVGTGDNTNKSFDLANGNVVDGSLTLKYGAASGANVNSFTALTLTTHYTVDLDGGTILLTTAGVTALGTNVLYADYIHAPKVSDTMVSSYLSSADSEVDKMTGTYWGAPISASQLFDGIATLTYPTTDEPYTRDYDAPDFVQLSQRNVTSVDGVYFLAKGVQLNAVRSYDSSATTYVDNTDNANTPGETGFAPFATATGANDLLYIGAIYKFHGLQLALFTAGVTSGTNTVEYYNGSSWVAFTPTESTTGVLNIAANGKLSWNPLSSWSKTTVNGSDSLYFVRIKANATYSTEPIVSSINMTQDFIISEQVPPYSIDWTTEGRVDLLDNRISNGSRNVLVRYQYGCTTTPPLIVELAALVAGLRMFANITGGSYDDVTHYTLGRKEVSIGEVYVNVAEVVKQFRQRIDDIVRLVGTQFAFGAV